ncbi:MAG: hypothetical protein ACQESR_02555 [Planctomycetota bacterium]
MNLRAVMLAMFGALVLFGLGGCAQLELSVGCCWPVVVIYLLVAVILAIHPVTRKLAVEAVFLGVLGGIFCCMMLASGPRGGFAIMAAVGLQIVLLVVGLSVLVAQTLVCIVSASRDKRKSRNSSEAEEPEKRQ